MKLGYDRAGDILVLELADLRESPGAVEVAPGVYVDVTANGKVLALEVLNASTKYPPEALEALAKLYEAPMPLAEAALLAGTTSDALYRAIRRGRLAGQLTGRDWLVTEEALQAYMASRTHAGPKRKRGVAEASVTVSRKSRRV